MYGPYAAFGKKIIFEDNQKPIIILEVTIRFVKVLS